jgi:two-component system, cell cycle sensor histidine kinase and response regulator CckA
VINQFQADLLGITPDAAVGRTTAELTNPEHGAKTAARDREVMDSCKPVQYEVQYPTLAGDDRPWLTTKAPLWMPDGIDSSPAGARGVVTVALDISALKAAEGALRRSEERYRQLFRAIPLPVFVYDARSLRILSVNEAAVRKYGYAREQFLAMAVSDVRAPDDPTRGPPPAGSLIDGAPTDSALLARRGSRPSARAARACRRGA